MPKVSHVTSFVLESSGFVLSLVARHPGLKVRSSWHRNFFETLAGLPAAEQTIGAAPANPAAPVDVYLVGGAAAPAQASPDQRGLQKLKAQLLRDYDRLAALALPSLAATHTALKNAAFLPSGFDQRRYLKAVARMARLAPFLWRDGGERQGPAIDTAGCRAAILGLTHRDIATITASLAATEPGSLGLALAELAKRPGCGWVATATRKARAFYGKAFQPMLRGQTAESGGQRHWLVLEEVPPMVALFRGLIGQDCATYTAPYHALVKGAKTYWVRRAGGERAKPEGYILAVPVAYEGRLYPFVVTINGAGLAAEPRRVLMALAALAEAWACAEIFLPDAGSVFDQSLTNFPRLRRQLRALPAAAARPVTLPKDWLLLSRKSLPPPPGACQSAGGYLGDASTALARPVASSALHGQLSVETLRTPRQRPVTATQALQVELLDRAYVAAQAIECFRSRAGLVGALDLDFAVKLGTQLALTRSQLAAADRFYNRAVSKPLSLKEFREVRSHLGIGLDSFRDLGFEAEVRNLAALHRAAPTLATAGTWAALFRRLTSMTDRRVGYHGETRRPLALSGPDALGFLLMNRRLPPCYRSPGAADDQWVGRLAAALAGRRAPSGYLLRLALRAQRVYPGARVTFRSLAAFAACIRALADGKRRVSQALAACGRSPATWLAVAPRLLFRPLDAVEPNAKRAYK